MIKGIGVDLVEMKEFTRLLRSLEAFEKRSFTAKERQAADQRHDRESYLATRFAAKEAVFKALAPLINGKQFDFRIVETLNREDGSPYIVLHEDLKSIMAEAKVDSLQISISDEESMVIAFVIAE